MTENTTTKKSEDLAEMKVTHNDLEKEFKRNDYQGTHLPIDAHGVAGGKDMDVTYSPFSSRSEKYRYIAYTHFLAAKITYRLAAEKERGWPHGKVEAIREAYDEATAYKGAILRMEETEHLYSLADMLMDMLKDAIIEEAGEKTKAMGLKNRIRRWIK
ncbi:MAG: hypothetical protein J7L32_05390 [Thermoplasmata archaeon]|nr:hypothetical protein [Thermoplasmata archaeon]